MMQMQNAKFAVPAVNIFQVMLIIGIHPDTHTDYSLNMNFRFRDVGFCV